MSVPSDMWVCPACGDYVPNGVKICPFCDKQHNRKISSPSIHVSNKSSAVQEKYILQPTNTSSGSFASGFLKFLAILTWIGGVLVAYSTASSEVYSKYTGYHAEINWVVFISTALIYLVSGGLMLCASELFCNIQRIADSLQRMEIKKF